MTLGTIIRVDMLEPGDELDMGYFAGIDPRDARQGPNTVNVRLRDGTHYTETAGARVRVHNLTDADARDRYLARHDKVLAAWHASEKPLAPEVADGDLF